MLLPGSVLWKKGLYQSIVIFNRNRSLQYWNISPFISQKSKEARASTLNYLKGCKSASSNGVDLTFRRTNNNVFGQGIWRISTNFATWILIVPLVNMTDPEDQGWNAQWKSKTGQTAQTSQRFWPVKWLPWSLYSFRGVPHIGIIFSRKCLAREEALACLGKIVVQWQSTNMSKTLWCMR